MVIIKRGQLAFEPIDAVEKKLVSIGGDDEARGHRKTGGCQSDEIAPPAADSRYKAGLRLIEVDDQTHKGTAFQSSTPCDYGCGEGQCPALMYMKFRPPFFWPAIAQDRQSCQSHFCLRKIHCCTGPLGRRAVGRQAKGFLWRRSGKIIAPSGNIAAHLEGLYKLVEEQAPILIATPAAAAESHCGRRRTTAKGVWVKSPSRVRIPLSASSTAIIGSPEDWEYWQSIVLIL